MLPVVIFSFPGLLVCIIDNKAYQKINIFKATQVGRREVKSEAGTLDY